MEFAEIFSGVIGMLVGVIITMLALSVFYVSKENCNKNVSNCATMQAMQKANDLKQEAELKSRLDRMDNASLIQYHMLRAIVSHMDNLSAEAKTSILNTNGVKR